VPSATKRWPTPKSWQLLPDRRRPIRGARHRLSVTTDSTAARPFVGGKIELAIADVSGDHYVDHEKEVRA
jgi:hypothetical protein